MFTVAIVGRANVGKSTLFNKLIRKNHAIVDDTPGVTRDRREAVTSLGDIDFKVIDTAGLEKSDKDDLKFRMFEQTQIAMKEADVVLFIIDSCTVITNEDIYFAKLLRKINDSVIVVANKSDSKYSNIDVNDLYKLGLGDPIYISAIQSIGLNHIYESLTPHYQYYLDNFGSIDLDINQDKAIQIAIIGRPNAGKSTLINSIINDNRLLTGAESGITRDSISIDWHFRGKKVKLIDTAGIRKKSKIQDNLEKLSVNDCFRATRFAHVCILLIDASKGIEHQDTAIANIMVKEGRAIIVAVNKSDLIEDKEQYKKELRDLLEHQLSQIKGVPIIMISAKEKTNIHQVIDQAIKINVIWNKRVATSELNNWLRRASEKNLAPLGSHANRIKVKYITQGNTCPPTFTLFVNDIIKFPKHYKQYLINSLRDEFNLLGVPIRMMLRKSHNPYNKKK